MNEMDGPWMAVVFLVVGLCACVRDYTKAEADRYGIRTGVKVRSQMEFDATTKKEKNFGGYL